MSYRWIVDADRYREALRSQREGSLLTTLLFVPAPPFIPQIEGQPPQIPQHPSRIVEPQPPAQILLLLEHVIPPGLGTTVHEQEQPFLVQAIPSEDVVRPSLLLTLLANPLVQHDDKQETPAHPVAVVPSTEGDLPSLLTTVLAPVATPFIPQLEGQPPEVLTPVSEEVIPANQILFLLEHTIPPLGIKQPEEQPPVHSRVVSIPATDPDQQSLLTSLLPAPPFVPQEEGQPQQPVLSLAPFDVEQPSVLTTLLAAVAAPFIPQEEGQPLEVLQPIAQEVIAPASILLLLEHTIPPLGIHVPEDRGSLDRFRIEAETLDTATRAQNENRSDLLLLLTIPTPPPGLGNVIMEDAGSLIRHVLLEQREYVSARAQVENNAPYLSLLAEHIVPPGLGPSVPQDFRTVADVLIADTREIEGSSVLNLLLSEVGLPPGLGAIAHEQEQPFMSIPIQPLLEVAQEGSSSLALLLAVFPPGLTTVTADDAISIVDRVTSVGVGIEGSSALNLLLAIGGIPPELGPVVYDETEDKDRTVLELYISKYPATMWNPFEKQGSNPILFLLAHELPLLGIVGHERDEISQDWWRQERLGLLSTIWTKEREGPNINLFPPGIPTGISVIGSFDRLRVLVAAYEREISVIGEDSRDVDVTAEF